MDITYCVCCSEIINPGDTYELVTLSLDTEYPMCHECAGDAADTSNKSDTHMSSRTATVPRQDTTLFGDALGPSCKGYPERCGSCGPDYLTNSGCFRWA